MVPPERVRLVNPSPERPDAAWVLYWMTAFRRTRHNHALEHAVARARALGLPLLVLEAIGVDHPWACRRFHRFVLDGMRDNAARLGEAYYPYVERAPGEGRGLLAALAGRAAVVVADDWPSLHLPQLVAAAGRLDVRVEAVDANGLLPLVSGPLTPAPSAHTFRRLLQKELPRHLRELPLADPLVDLPSRAPQVPGAITDRWKPGFDIDPSHLPIDAEVGPVAAFPGGETAAHARLAGFLARIDAYATDRNDPDADASSGLSSYLHWGHIGTHGVVEALFRQEGWTPDRVSAGGNGSREGWWHVSPAAEGFLDELVTWRELGFNWALRRPGANGWSSVPGWARATLEAHAVDPRPHAYTFEQLEAADTHDPLWNAAQTQLREEGRIHNYMRMLWGKKVLEWSPTPEEAARRLVALNDRWALDGRDPNSYNGIYWVFGRCDRPWGPERPVYGTIRYMTSENTRRKLNLERWLTRWSPGRQAPLMFR